MSKWKLTEKKYKKLRNVVIISCLIYLVFLSLLLRWDMVNNPDEYSYNEKTGEGSGIIELRKQIQLMVLIAWITFIGLFIREILKNKNHWIWRLKYMIKHPEEDELLSETKKQEIITNYDTQGNIKYSEWGFANRIGDLVVLNENLKKYPKLHEQVLLHEIKHTRQVMQDIKHDIHDVMDHTPVDIIHKIFFFMKHPKSLTQLSPVWFYEGRLYLDLSYLIIYSLIIAMYVISKIITNQYEPDPIVFSINESLVNFTKIIGK